MAEKAMVNGTSALRIITIEAAQEPKTVKLRVAAYVRVSSSSDDQKNSFEAQLRYYNALIDHKENWTMVDLYADEGITGTSAQKRKDFQRLLSDYRRGKIDRVLTKSVSRFARNTKECLEAIQKLKQLGIGILFKEQNIDTACPGRCLQRSSPPLPRRKVSPSPPICGEATRSECKQDHSSLLALWIQGGKRKDCH